MNPEAGHLGNFRPLWGISEARGILGAKGLSKDTFPLEGREYIPLDACLSMCLQE